jgi:predicted acylesterase/phospholipase RssA
MHDEKVIHSAYMFDMLAGTSTGSILSAGLVFPDPDNPAKPKYTAELAADVYIDGAKFIFTPNGWGPLVGFLLSIGFGISFAALFFWQGRRKYHNPKTLKSLFKYEEFLEEVKEFHK